MNKALVISAVALTALVGKSDVVANNVVGYMNKETSAELYCMICPTFQNVGQTTFSLADLKGDGYEASHPNTAATPRYTGGCKGGDFEVEVLNNYGNIDKTLPGGGMYFWVDAKTGKVSDPTVYEPGWYLFDEEQVDYVKMDDEIVKSISFPLGQAFWVKAGTKTLVSAGEVSKKDLAIDTNGELYTAIGNGIPVDMTLGDLTGDGYEASHPNTAATPRYTGGCKGGDFEVEILNNYGNIDKTLPGGGMYFWVDAKTGKVSDPTVYEPGWYLFDEEQVDYVKMTTEQVNAVKIKAGQGLWVKAGSKQLVFPSPLADHTEK